MDSPLKRGLSVQLSRIYEQGTQLQNGGLFGALLGAPLRLGCGDLPSKIIVIVLIFTFIMLLTGAKAD